MDVEIGKLMVVNKIVCEYCILSGISIILQNSYIKIYYIMSDTLIYRSK